MAEYLAPGVFVEEVQGGPRMIEGVDTSTTAFIGRTRRGPLDAPTMVKSFAEFERRFGGFSRSCTLPYAVHQYFENGGLRALIVRVRNGSQKISDAQISDVALRPLKKGLWALDQAEYFGLLCIPPLDFRRDVARQTWDAAAQFCEQRGAFLIIDPPLAWNSSASALASQAVESVAARTAGAALYFPRLLAVDGLDQKTRVFAPCGAVAGVIARTDAQSGVWKTPAGANGQVMAATAFSVALNDVESSSLNQQSINVLRVFPGRGLLVWGARTLAPASGSDPDFKYVPYRRLRLFLQESIRRSLQWAVFEPNDEPLWAALRSSTENFLLMLWRNGAFHGSRPTEAFFVQCGRTTMTQADIEQGRIELQVGFAAFRPAEFSLLRIRLASAESPS